jgi:hypothetical protein
MPIGSGMQSSKREGGFIKKHVVRDDDPICSEVQAPVTLMLHWVAKEHINGRAGCEFVGGYSCEVWVALAPENMKMRQFWVNGKKCKMWRGK